MRKILVGVVVVALGLGTLGCWTPWNDDWHPWRADDPIKLPDHPGDTPCKLMTDGPDYTPPAPHKRCLGAKTYECKGDAVPPGVQCRPLEAEPPNGPDPGFTTRCCN